MTTTFPIRAWSTITFTNKKATSACSRSRKNKWTAKQRIVCCVKRWPQSVHLLSGKASFTMLCEILGRGGKSPRQVKVNVVRIFAAVPLHVSEGASSDFAEFQ